MVWIDASSLGNVAKMMSGFDPETSMPKPKDQLIVATDDGLYLASEITRVVSPKAIDDDARRKRGCWECPKTGEWHEKDEKCGCYDSKISPVLLEEGRSPEEDKTGLSVYHEIMRQKAVTPMPYAILPKDTSTQLGTGAEGPGFGTHRQ